MEKQFANSIEKLNEDHLRAVTVVNNDSGAGIVCNANAEELKAKFGTIENFFNGLFEKGIKALRITDKRKNGSTYRAYGDEYVFEFAPVQKVIEAPTQSAPLNGGLNAGLNATIYRDMDYGRIAAELETSKSEVKRLIDENRRMETKILVSDTLEGKSIARSEANAKMMESATPIFAALAEKLMMQNSAAQSPGLNGANLSEIKQQAVKMVTQLQDDVVDNIAFIMSRLKNEEILNDMLALATKAEKYN